MTPLQKLTLDLTPLLVFLVSYYALGVYWATGAFVVATVIAAGISYAMNGRISPLMIFSGLFVVVLGGLTIWLKNDIFIRMKPTLYYFGLAAFLFGGLRADRLVIKDLLEFAYKLTDEGWRIFTKRFATFCVAVGVLNIAVAYALSFEAWLWFKIIGFTGLSFVFFLSQAAHFERYEIKQEGDGATPKTA